MPLFKLVAALLLVVGCDAVGVDPVPVSDARLDGWDRAMLSAVNEERAKGGTCGTTRMGPARPLVWDERLERAALKHSEDMASRGYFSHTGPRGRGPGDRARAAGYEWSVVAENLAWGHETIKEVVVDWIANPGHCRNILDPDLMEMGAAETGSYWTQVFGSPR